MAEDDNFVTYEVEDDQQFQSENSDGSSDESSSEDDCAELALKERGRDCKLKTIQVGNG